jgi:uncharacterized MAPEG superfamily protein
MNTFLSSELYWLVFTLLMTSLYWVPYILNRMFEQGILNAIYDPYGHTETRTAWANRMRRAHENAIENLAIFAPLVIAVQITNHNTELTSAACAVYFFARLLHYFAFTFAIPILRVMTFLAGFSAQLVLALTLLGV